MDKLTSMLYTPTLSLAVGTISYLNGNYITTLKSNGTKIYRGLRRGEAFQASFPDSIDLKITNKCSHGCPWCHESSNSHGKSFDISKTKEVLQRLPNVGIELAIGGGNVMELDQAELMDFLKWGTEVMHFQNRLTITWDDYVQNKEFVSLLFNQSLIGGIGISLTTLPDDIDVILSRPIVFHIIAGIFPPTKIRELLGYGKVLVLGYKSWGRGTSYGVPDLNEWRQEIKSIIYESRHGNQKNQCKVGLAGNVLSFDNLGIEQLGIEGSMLGNEWESYYMGPEFSHSMYIDAVEEIIAPTSRDPFRVSWSDCENNILEWFKNNRNDD